MSETKIEALNLSDLTQQLLECPEKVYAITIISGILSKRANMKVSTKDVMEFRKKLFLNRNEIVAPLVKKSELTIPQTLDEMSKFALADTLSLRHGAIQESFNIFKDERTEKNNQTALKALEIMLKGAESYDKRLLKIAPDSDPAQAIFKSREFQIFKSAMIRIAERHPEIDIMGELQEELNRSEIVDAEYTEKQYK